MASIFSEPFDTVPGGVAVSTANTVFDLVSISGSSAFVGATGTLKNNGARIDASAAGVSGRASWTAVTSNYHRLYLRLSSYPSANMGIMSIRSAVTVRANIQLSPSGIVRVRDGLVLSASSTNVLPLNQWVRLEWFWDSAGGTQAVRIYIGANLHSPSTYTELVMASVSSGSADNSTVGVLDGITIPNFQIDEYAVDDGTWVGPVMLSTNSWLKHAVSGSWQNATAHNLSGGSW